MTTARVLLASALSVSALLAAAACSVGRDDPRALPLPEGVPQPSSASATAAASATERPAPAPPSLSEAQLRAALVTETDLGEPWMASRGAATWRDGLLKADTDHPDCRRLLDSLYTEELFGAPSGPRATATLDDTYNDTQLRHQVAAYRPADVDRVLSWLATLPDTCERFRATTTRAGAQVVEVTELPLPEAGDARTGLRVTMTGEASDGMPTYLTVDLAGVRVGDDAITLTNGGFGAVLPEVTQAVAQLGAERLAEVARQGRVRV
ncbi:MULTISPECIES: hypothetical protein [Streptomyces]|jgi:hypothetical protein|uniref:Secreted protein n=2 Tax=Streptomyces TaxID=1883 RepID=A0A514JRI2_9ACTN|nr:MULTISPECIES: hypothetical protein [Streptomyces]MBA8943575.1 hypothetical protein [Streptomyces calvus]MBA8977201.1 hypothetical protein [Streptomyces calvus]MYS30244.1 hypothetical protein [Streptomyces sp. SID7804]QDI69966.1 hypothetical protein CD934_15625 [Streptomyces calvus]GGP39748.1 hypothetical protein GCM10010247_10040 [Streptomyces calvus]